MVEQINKANIERHARHIMLKEIGGHGQKLIANSTIAIIGVGGLGCPCALYLAAAGVGKLILIDDDVVDLSNLQRQILFKTSDIGHPKVIAAQEALNAIDGDIEIIAVKERINGQNANELLANADIIIDGSDNFKTRFLINKTAYDLKKVLVSGALGRFDGQVAAFDFSDPQSPCYQCFVPDTPPIEEDCNILGVVGAICGIIGALMALETIKIITKNRETSLLGRILLYDGLKAQSRTLNIPKDRNCNTCGHH